jgi:integrase
VGSPVPPQSRVGRRPTPTTIRWSGSDCTGAGAIDRSSPSDPRAVPDYLFAALGCNRDRALFSMFLSSGARAEEMLGLTVADTHPGEGRIYVRTKGLGGAKEVCPAAPEAFAWLALSILPGVPCGRPVVGESLERGRGVLGLRRGNPTRDLLDQRLEFVNARYRCAVRSRGHFPRAGGSEMPVSGYPGTGPCWQRQGTMGLTVEAGQ